MSVTVAEVPTTAAPLAPDVASLPDFRLPDLALGLDTSLRPPQPSTPPEMPPAMSGAEQALLRAAASGSRTMVEFGCGGSTGLLLDAAEGRLLSVDSDQAWLARVAQGAAAARALRQGRMVQWHAEIGPTRDWGWPLMAPSADTGWRYWGAPWFSMPRADFVLVDGRFRIACALSAHGRLDVGGHLAIHDYWPRRAYQDALAPFFEVVGSAGTLALMKPRPARPEDLQAALESHAADPR